MLYLSRIILDIHNRMVQRDLADCHKLHRRILDAFPTAPPGTNARDHFGLLYRAEPFERENRLVRVLVQSAEEPNWLRLPASYFGPAPDGRGNPTVRLVDAEYEQVQTGMQLVFRLRANPTKRISRNNAEQGEQWRGKRIELRREEDQLAWLVRKGQQGGFRLVEVALRPEVLDTRVSTQEKIHGRRPAHDGAASMPLSFGATLFEGRLEVTDRTAFLATLRTGIGSGKAFGFGLLSVATAR
ncbi:MAG: type I-E CRISPR-associated protein Cas6/Cse3/CasE [Chloroflexales bacterium]|nr:type I-E CRISPR-associated protein Cas6/Cse3/CasE [Chloroflexales bacterium]